MYYPGAGRRGRCKYSFWCNDIDLKNLELDRKFDVGEGVIGLFDLGCSDEGMFWGIITAVEISLATPHPADISFGLPAYISSVSS